MVKNVSSSSNLRGSTSALPLRPSQIEKPAAVPVSDPILPLVAGAPSQTSPEAVEAAPMSRAEEMEKMHLLSLAHADRADRIDERQSLRQQGIMPYQTIIYTDWMDKKKNNGIAQADNASVPSAQDIQDRRTALAKEASENNSDLCRRFALQRQRLEQDAKDTSASEKESIMDEFFAGPKLQPANLYSGRKYRDELEPSFPHDMETAESLFHDPPNPFLPRESTTIESQPRDQSNSKHPRVAAAAGSRLRDTPLSEYSHETPRIAEQSISMKQLAAEMAAKLLRSNENQKSSSKQNVFSPSVSNLTSNMSAEQERGVRNVTPPSIPVPEYHSSWARTPTEASLYENFTKSTSVPSWARDQVDIDFASLHERYLQDKHDSTLAQHQKASNYPAFVRPEERSDYDLFLKQKSRSQHQDASMYPDSMLQPPTSLYERYQNGSGRSTLRSNQMANAAPSQPTVETKRSAESMITRGLEREVREQNLLKSPEAYTQPFCDFLTENPTVWHAVQYFEKKLDAAGFKKLSERQSWNATLEKGGKYYVSRNGTSLIAFTVGAKYESGNGVAMVGGHVDALTARLKPVSTKTTKAGYLQLGVAPYAGALNSTWWDRDLGVGGRVLVKNEKTGKIETKLVKLGWPIARIPTLAPHFGVGMIGSNNPETEAVPIIGLDSSPSSTSSEFQNMTLGGAGTFAATQPPKLVRAIAGELSIQDYSTIVNWELELFDTQPAQVGGLEKEFIFAGRIDDKLCSWSAIQGLLASAATPAEDDGIVKLVGLFDDEEIGSLLRQGARSNFLPSTIERITESLSTSSSANTLAQTYANSFFISADVTHAVNPNFLDKYLENHAPRLNTGLVVSADSNGHLTTDSVSTALLTRVAEKCKSELQLFMIRNDSRSGNTIGPVVSSELGVRAIDAGIPQLSMHSIRATTGSLDPGLGVKIFKGFFDTFESIDKEFE